jgi:hypothetical protein
MVGSRKNRSQYDQEIVMEFVLVIYQPWELLEEGVFSGEESAELAKYPEIVATPGMKANFPLGYRKDAARIGGVVEVRPVGMYWPAPPE